MGKFCGVLIAFGLIAASLVAASTPATGASVVCSTDEMPFVDVDPDSYARDDIACLYDLEITMGTSPTTYAPDDTVTRREMAAFLGRTIDALAIHCDRDAALPFTDVADTDWSRDDVACILDLGITTGTSATTYSPGQPVTRRQMAAFLARTWERTGQTCETWTNPFGDISVDNYAFDSISCLWLLGITNGTTDATFGPDDLVTREQMAAFIGRLLRAEPSPTTPTEILAGLGWHDDADVNARLHMSVIGEQPDGPGNPRGLCGDGLLQEMDDDPYCGYVDVGCWCVSEINRYREAAGLEPFVRAPEHDACTAREARIAAELGKSHHHDGCNWRAQASAGGGRGGDDSAGTVKRSVEWLPYLIHREGPGGGHYDAMMSEEVKAVSCSYYAIDRDTHRTFINYYDLPAA